MKGVKTRFDGLDVTAMTALVHQQLLGRKIVNVYDAADNNSSYVLKLEGKDFLLLESGVRFHRLPHFASEQPMPSPFCAKLRKHLRGLRLEQVRQLGTDRVVLFQWGSGTNKHSIILELYAKGNIILTNHEYKILALLRSHAYQKEDSDDKVAVQVGSVYPVSYATSLGDSGTVEPLLYTLSEEERTELLAPSTTSSGQPTKGKKKAVTLKTLLLQTRLGVSHYGPALLEHCILHANLQPHIPLQPLSTAEWERLVASLQSEGPSVMEALQNNASKAYILYRPNNESTVAEEPTTELAHADKVLEEFLPHLLLQHQGRPHLEYDNFGDAVAVFFGQIVTQRRLLKAQAAESAVEEKLEKIRKDQENRLLALEEEQELFQAHAAAVERNAEEVEKALMVINSALDSGMDWDQLEQLVEVEQKNGNPVALLIQKLNLEKDEMTLRLAADPYDEESVEYDISISLKETAHGNASQLFAKYRAFKDKSQKTIEASSKALKAAEESAQRQLADAQKKSKLASASVGKRKPLWFEKFHWFITSDNYLVLGGKDAHQNEMLVKRYLRPGDAYLHADVHGASSCILRAKRRRLPDGSTAAVPLSEQALREAGNFTICRSSAWSSRMVTSAWWVESHQVSKTAPTGEYLTVGSFMIRGKKTFLPPSQLEMGLAVLFRLGDEESIERHKNERRDFALMELDEADDQRVLPKAAEQTKASRKGNDTSKAPVAVAAADLPSAEKPVDGRKIPSASLQSPSESADGETPDPESGSNELRKRGLSARDRRMIKKYGSLAAAEEALREREETNSDGGQDEDTVTLATESGATPKKRGQKGRRKRMAKKYSDQDEEDRELAMLALQGGEKTKRKGKGSRQVAPVSATEVEVAETTAALLVKDSSTLAEGLDKDIRLQLETMLMTRGDPATSDDPLSLLDVDVLEQLVAMQSPEEQSAALKRFDQLLATTDVADLSSSLGGIIRTIRKYGLDSFVKTKLEEPKDIEVRGNDEVDEGNQSDTEEDAVDDTVELHKLAGRPVAEDAIVFAVPVCAPYQTLSKYSYRVKLTPGSMKRGKAVKQCVDMFLKGDSASKGTADTRFRDMIKKVGEPEWVQAICADVKIAAPGASKATKQQKAKKGRK